jgi:two-component system nitrate/nitrite sensor histidine kinase NarX
MLSTRIQVRIILVGLALIAITAASVAYLETRDHDEDHIAMGVVTHQRELARLISLMAWADPASAEVNSSLATFQENLRLLRRGGGIHEQGGNLITLPAEEDPRVVARLDEVARDWQTLRDRAQEVRSMAESDESFDSAVERLGGDTIELLESLRGLNDTYESHMLRDLEILRQVQTVLLLMAIALLGWAVWIIRQRIVRPTTLLKGVFQGQQDTQIAEVVPEGLYRDEVVQLLDSFNEVRPQLEAASQSLENLVLERTRLLMTAFEYSQELLVEQRLNSLLLVTTEKAQALLNTHSAALCLLERDGSFLELRSARGKVAAEIGIGRNTIPSEPMIAIGPVDEDSDENPCENCAFWQACGVDNCLSTPLQVGDETIGALCVVRELDKPFDHDELRALGLLANVAAAAISNARLTESSHYQVRRKVAIAERERLATQLHDSLAQTLSYLNLRVNRAREMMSIGVEEDVAREFEGIHSATRQAFGQVRHVLGGLSEPVSAQVSQEIADFVEQYRRATELNVTLHLDDAALEALPAVTQNQALHIVREALTNVHRHAQATQVSVRVEQVKDGYTRITITDDGVGFELDRPDDETHLGLPIMSARAERCGGRLTIRSELGQGSRVEVDFYQGEREEIR